MKHTRVTVRLLLLSRQIRRTREAIGPGGPASAEEAQLPRVRSSPFLKQLVFAESIMRYGDS